MRRRGPGLIGTMARTAVIAGTASAVAGNVQHKQQQKFAAQNAAQQPATEPVMAAPAAPVAANDPLAEVQKLAGLHAAGILTDEEFAAAKAKALGI